MNDTATSESQPVKGASADFMLGTWKEGQRGMPRAFTQHPVFGVINRKATVSRKMLGCQKHYFKYAKAVGELHLTGEELGHKDLNVFLECCDIANRAGAATFHTSKNAFLKLLGHSTGGKAVVQLVDSLSRLKSYQVTLRFKGRNYTTNLIKEFSSGKDGLDVELDERLPDFFTVMPVVFLNKKKRMGLNSDLEKCMHSYVSTHSSTVDKPSHVKIDKLKVICRSGATDKRFNSALKLAMKELLKAKVIVKWEFKHSDTTLMYVRSKAANRVKKENAIWD